jgi:hypothetical protein
MSCLFLLSLEYINCKRKNSKMTELSKKITIKIQENEYEVSFPNNGQLIDIEVMKQGLSKGTQDSLLSGLGINANLAWMTIEMIATFTILIPDLIKSLRVENLLELDPMQSKELRKVYVDVYYKWYNEWMAEINDEVKEEEKSPEFVDEDIETVPNEA